MAEESLNPVDSCSFSEETWIKEPVVSREPAQADVVIQPNTTCAQCKKEVRSPHLLFCLHSVCAECLPAITIEGERIKCGECGNTSTHCSSSSSTRKGVENQCGADAVHCVPVPNGPLSRYIEGVKIIGRARSPESILCGNKRCKISGGDSPSIVYCTHCSIFMCERCNYGHEVAPPCEDHTVKNMEEMGGFSPADFQQMLSFSADPTVAEPHYQAFKIAHQATICFGKKCEAVEEQLQTELRTVDQITEASLGDLNTAFQSIHAAMQRRKEELHRQIINTAEEKKIAIESRLRSVQSEKKTAVNAASTLDFLLKSSNTHDLIASKDLAQTHQSVLNSKWCDDELKTTVSSVLSFEAANQEDVLKALKEFGIVADGACPEKCTVEAKPKQLQSTGANPEPLKVVTFDSKGIACTRGGDKIEAFLHPKSRTAGPAIKARVEDNANGTYSVSFPTVYPGPSLLSIEVNGKNIKGSPFVGTLHRHIRCIKSPKSCLLLPQKPGFLYGVAISMIGTIFVSDYTGHKIHVFSKERKFMKSFDTGGSEGKLGFPVGLTVSSGGLVCVTDFRGQIQIFSEDGTLVRQFGSGQLATPFNVTIHKRHIYVADTGNHRVAVYTMQGKHVRNIAKTIEEHEQRASPSGVAFSPNGEMYVTDFNKHHVQVFDVNGHYKRVFGQGQLKKPRDIAIASNGDVLIADNGNGRVSVFSTWGNTNNLIHGIKVDHPTGLAIDKDGGILVAEYTNARVLVF